MRKVISQSSCVTQTLHQDNADAYRGAIQIAQDVDPVLKMVRAAREQPVSKEFRKMAEVPMVVYLQACAEGWANDPAAWRRWANDPDNAAFRVAGGKL